jgi:hypothetical protein
MHVRFSIVPSERTAAVCAPSLARPRERTLRQHFLPKASRDSLLPRVTAANRDEDEADDARACDIRRYPSTLMR